MFNQNCYISSAANATPQAVHWGNNNLICYASCNAILIYDPTIGKVVKTLCKHTKKVNAVKWIRGVSYEKEFVSCSADGNVIVWSLKDKSYNPVVLEGHKGTVSILEAMYKDETGDYAIVVSAGVDSTIRIWSREVLEGDFNPIQEINLGYSLCIAIKLTYLPCKTLLLACGIDNNNIDLYVDSNKDVIEFSLATNLKGHSDWVRAIDFKQYEDKFLLTSSSQDYYIRMHEISVGIAGVTSIDFKTSKQTYKIELQSILMGHEGWVYSINWSPNDVKLLSASIDKTLVIWEFDKIANLWLETTRLGEVGGNTLGFYGAMFSPDGKSIIAHSYHGAFHIYNYIPDLNIWDSMVTVGGHFGEVTDLGWEPKGEFLISASADQTTRVHAPWKTESNTITWHEIARPQVHGYDLSSLAILSRYKYASGAEEKIVRAFQAPTNFVENFKRICFIEEEEEEDNDEILPKGASVPSLGLSNKAVFEDNNEMEAKPKDHKNPYPEESSFSAVDLYNPPTEETLIQNTLWPEIQKLYGHGYEVYALAASSDGKFLASTCKSTTKEHAAILLWDTSSWQLHQKLHSHTLTVVQMSFSPNCNYLLSVSRDRRWSLFEKTDENKFEIVATTDKKTGIHSRIIWCCNWSHDSKYFATGSRDGKVVIWTKNEEKPVENVLGKVEAASKPLENKESVTAVGFGPVLDNNGCYIIAIGFENGEIHVYKWLTEWSLVHTLDNGAAHHLTVKRLAFRPVVGCAGQRDSENFLQLASCSSDHSVRIYNLDISVLK
nr:probable elongator complex protein 2 [Onthophagus taurus]